MQSITDKMVFFCAGLSTTFRSYRALSPNLITVYKDVAHNNGE